MKKTVILPYFSKKVSSDDSPVFTSIYPIELRLILFKILPLLFTTTEIPEFADLKKKTDFSTDLKICDAKCCLGPIVLPNQASLVIFTNNEDLLFENV